MKSIKPYPTPGNRLHICKPCEKAYLRERKLKKVQATLSSGERNIISFTYADNVVKSATQKFRADAAKYDFYYIDPACLLSGFDVKLTRGAAPTSTSTNLRASFLYSKRKKISRVMFKSAKTIAEIPFKTFENEFTYGTLGRIKQDWPLIEDEGYADDVIMTFTFAAAGDNITESKVSTGIMQSIKNIVYDNKKNPFSTHGDFFYWVKLMPYVSRTTTDLVKKADVFLGLFLSKNNPRSFVFEDALSGMRSQYSFHYTYDAGDYPTAIKMYKADYAGSVLGPRSLLETLSLSYL